jgi:hypothetical protein
VAVAAAGERDRDPDEAGSDDGEATVPVTVVGRTDRRRVTIGTPFRYTIEVRARKDVELIVPVLGGRLGEFSITDFGEEPVHETGDDVVVTRWYTLVAYRPGFSLIPGLTVQYRGAGDELRRIDGQDVGINVVSLLDQQPDADSIRDIKGPVAVPFDWTPVLIGLGVLAGIVGLGLIALRLSRRINAPQGLPAVRPAHAVALEALERLRHRRLTGAEERAEWYVALSAIVRTYIEGRFKLRAPEMTTEEFIYAVQRDSTLSTAHRQLLGEFLAECDLVKFARHVPRLEDAERAYGAARRFVDETRPRPAPEEARHAA